MSQERVSGVGGESVAGESVAGESVAGESVACRVSRERVSGERVSSVACRVSPTQDSGLCLTPDPCLLTPHLPSSFPAPVPLHSSPAKKPETWGERTQCLRFPPIGSWDQPSTRQSCRLVPSFSLLSVQEIILFCTLSFFFIFLPCLSLAGWRPLHLPGPSRPTACVKRRPYAAASFLASSRHPRRAAARRRAASFACSCACGLRCRLVPCLVSPFRRAACLRAYPHRQAARRRAVFIRLPMRLRPAASAFA